MSEIPEPLRELSRQTEDFDPGPAAKRRVLAAVNERVQKQAGGRRQMFAALGAAAVVAVAALAMMWTRSGDQDHDATAEAPSVVEGNIRVVSATQARRDGAVLRTGDRTSPGRFEVADGGRLRAALVDAEVVAVGPAIIELSDDEVLVREGEVRVAGSAIVRGADCTLEPDESFEVGVRTTGTEILDVRIYAGSVSRAEPAYACRFVELATAPTASSDSVVQEAETALPDTELIAPRPRPSPRPDEEEPEGPQTRAPESDSTPSTSVVTPSEPSDLAREVRAYREALGLRGNDDNAALERFREIRHDFPNGTLAHEVGIQILDALGRLGRDEAQRREARRFLSRWPESPRADEIRAVLAEPSAD